jgi:hypothetical protein
MSLAIDEITTEVEAPQTPAAPAAESAGQSRPEIEFRRQCDLLTRLEERAARVRAD